MALPNIAIIPARKKSKSILNKNLQKVGNRSLLKITVDSAIESGIFSQIILTTDIETAIDDFKDIIDVRTRPKHLGKDDTLMKEVVVDTLNAFGIDNKSIVWLLQPTSPFRKKEDFVEIQELINKGIARSVISVFDVESLHPSRMYTIKNDRLYPLKHDRLFLNKQALPSVYVRSGHFYVFHAKDLRLNKSFDTSPCLPFVMEKVRSSNIDNPFDLIMARLIYREGLCR